MTQALEALLRRLDLRALSDDTFEGEKEPNSWGRLFGGMVAAQALSAACRTVEPDRVTHSLHAYFLRPGDPDQPVHYAVDRIRDGRSFTTRRVVASQSGKAIFNMSASFHVLEPGFEHQMTMPEAPPPTTLKGWNELAAPIAERMAEPQKSRFLKPRPIEMRYMHVPTFMGGPASDGDNMVWLRAAGELPDDHLVHQCVLTYATDMSLLDNIIRPHGARQGGRGGVQMASLDHAVWFHRPDLKADEWLLYHQDTPAAFGARGLARGSIYDRGGRLVASVAQEGLMRPARAASAAPSAAE